MKAPFVHNVVSCLTCLTLVSLFVPWAVSSALAETQAVGSSGPAYAVGISCTGDQALETGGLAARLQRLRLDRERLAAAHGSAVQTVVNTSVPVLMGNYADEPHDLTPAMFQDHLFDNNPTGSMSEYYDEVSYGQFQLDGTVYGPFTADSSRAYYTSIGNGWTDAYPQNAAGFSVSVLDQADSVIDFAQYDNDGPDGVPNSGDDDGMVDALIMIHPGGAANPDPPNFWPHANRFSGMGGTTYTTNDPRSGGGFVYVDLYTIQASEKGNGSANTIKPIHVFCHEYAHTLGLPDLYDSDGSTHGIGSWCLMGDSYGINGSRPRHMSAWCKAFLGWVVPNIVETPQHVQLPPVETSPVVYKLWEDPFRGGRYFLLENRTQQGFDGDILGEGVLIWHVNEEAHRNKDESYRKVDLEEADGVDDLDHAVNYMDDGDVYPGATNNQAFTNETYPNSADCFGEPTYIRAENFAYVSGPGSDVTVDLTPRHAYGYTLRYHSHCSMRDTTGAVSSHGAVRFTATQPGELVAVQAACFANSPTDYEVRIFGDLSGGQLQNLQSTTTGVFPNVASRRYHEIGLSAETPLSASDAFLVDIDWGSSEDRVPWTERAPISGQSYYSDDGVTYTPLASRDVLVTGRIRTGCAVAITGDVDLSWSITSADIIYLVNFVFKGGPEPLPIPQSGDANTSGSVTSADIIYLVGFVFQGGPEPTDVCDLL